MEMVQHLTKDTRVLIVGGAGYVGGCLTDVLSPLCQVTVYDNLLYEERFLKNVKFIYGDCRDREKLLKLLPEYDVVVWLAAVVGDAACAIDPFLTQSINEDAVRWLVDNYKGKIVYPSTCHDSQTMAWTKDGPKPYYKLSITDEILTLNIRSNHLEWKRPKRIVVKDFDGDLITTDGRRISFAVTPEHRILCRTQKGAWHYRTADTLLNSNSNLFFPTDFCWTGQEHAEQYEFPAKQPYGRGCDRWPNTMSIVDLCYLVGLFLGDGYVTESDSEKENKSGLSFRERSADPGSRDSRGRFVSATKRGPNAKSICKNHGVHFCLPATDPSRMRLLQILDRYGIRYWANNDRVGVSSKVAHDWFTQFGVKSHQKYIPSFFKNLPTKCLQRLLLGLIHSDGNHARFAMGGAPEYHTVSEQLAYDVSEVALKTGWSAHISIRHCDGYIDGRRVCGDAYWIGLSSAHKHINTAKCIRPERYIGKVWCLEMEDNDNFFILRHGTINVTGNCSVYGCNNDHDLNEDSPTNPLSTYAITKLAAERYILEHAKDPLVFRLGTLFGLGDEHSRIRLDLVINLFAYLVAANRQLTVCGGNQLRPVLHVKDVAGAIAFGLANGISGLYVLHSLNVTIGQLGNIILHDFPNAKIHRADIAFEDARNYHVSSDKLRRLGWLPDFTVRQGIREIHDAILQHRIKCPDSTIYFNVKHVQQLKTCDWIQGAGVTSVK